MTPSIDALRQIVATHTAETFTWPGEKVITTKGLDEEELNALIEAGYVEPLWVDPTTANLLVTLFDRAKPSMQVKLADMISSSRATFGLFVEAAWNCVK